jgi:hypothetical protein
VSGNKPIQFESVKVMFIKPSNHQVPIFFIILLQREGHYNLFYTEKNSIKIINKVSNNC